jgi:hypothetical protein
VRRDRRAFSCHCGRILGVLYGGIERLLHLLSQLTRSEPLDCPPYWLVQCVTPLLQTQEEALDTRPLLKARLLLPDMLHTGDLDVYIADFSQGACEAPQLLTPFCVWLSYQSP